MSKKLKEFSFGTLGSDIDTFFSEMEERAGNLASRSENLKTIAVNAVNAVPRIIGDFQVDLCETPTEIIVTCDLPGMEKQNVSVKLLNETSLQIKTIHDGTVAATDVSGVYHLQERKSGAGERIIILPANVIVDGAKATFKNGIMKITLTKSFQDAGISIEIK